MNERVLAYVAGTLSSLGEWTLVSGNSNGFEPRMEDEAIRYAEMGWPVFPLWPMRDGSCACGRQGIQAQDRAAGRAPCSPGKHPIGSLVPNGLHDSSSDPERVRSWWRTYPDAGIGLATGELSGLLVVDVDTPTEKNPGDGRHAWQRWQDLNDSQGRVPRVRTGSGGSHVYYAHVEGFGNRANVGGEHIDLRGEGGYVILPPTLHESGARYVWEVTPSTPMPVMPPWLREIMAPLSGRERRKVEVPESIDWDGTIPASVSELMKDNKRLQQLMRRDKRLSMGPDGSPSGYDAKLATLLAWHDIPCEEIASSIMYSRSQDPDCWAKHGSRPSYYLHTAVTAIDHVSREREKTEEFADVAKKTGWPHRFGSHHEHRAIEVAVDVIGRNLARIRSSGSDLVWDSRRWCEEGATDRALLYAKDFVALAERMILAESQSGSDSMQKSAVKFTRKMLSLSGWRTMAEGVFVHRNRGADDFNASVHELNVQNGILDLRTGELRDHERAAYFTRITAGTYDPEARDAEWELLLSESLEPEHLPFFQRLMGYSLLGHQPEQVFAFVFGPGGTGKSTVLGAIERCLGSFAQPLQFTSFLEHRGASGSAPTPDLVSLFGARLVTAVETSPGQHFDAGLVKQITGGDTFTARALYRQPLSFRPQCLLTFVANERPRADACDGAFFRRLVPIPFLHERKLAEQDSSLGSRLLRPEAMQAILAWLVAGCQDYLERGLDLPSWVLDERASYIEHVDPLTDFWDEMVVDGLTDESRVTRRELALAYNGWCTDSKVKYPLGPRKLAELVRRRGGVREGQRHDGKRVWVGIRLRTAFEL